MEKFSAKLAQLLTVLFVLAVACGSQPAIAQKSVRTVVPAGARYIRNNGNQRVIVFVPGLYGDPNETWMCDPKHYWPEMLADDPTAGQSDIYVASYPTPSHGSNMTIGDEVTLLQNQFENDKVFSNHREVVFVAHSLGGILVQELLLTYRDLHLFEKVSFIYLYATPQLGSKVANIAKTFSHDPKLKELMASKNNFILPDMDEKWIHAGFESVKRYCAYETKSTKGFKVVDWASATRGCQDSVAINANHSSIVKPCSTEDASYTALRNKLRDDQFSSLIQNASDPTNDSHKYVQQNSGGNNFQGDVTITAVPQGRRLPNNQLEIFSKVLQKGPKGILVVVLMLPVDQEMKDFGDELRTAANNAGWGQTGTLLNTSTHPITLSDGGGANAESNLPIGTHCIFISDKNNPSYNASESFKSALNAARIACPEGNPDLYPPVKGYYSLPSAVTIYIGSNVN